MDQHPSPSTPDPLKMGLSIGNTAFQLTEGIRQRLENRFSTKGQEKPPVQHQTLVAFLGGSGEHSMIFTSKNTRFLFWRLATKVGINPGKGGSILWHHVASCQPIEIISAHVTNIRLANEYIPNFISVSRGFPINLSRCPACPLVWWTAEWRPHPSSLLRIRGRWLLWEAAASPPSLGAWVFGGSRTGKSRRNQGETTIIGGRFRKMLGWKIRAMRVILHGFWGLSFGSLCDTCLVHTSQDV